MAVKTDVVAVPPMPVTQSLLTRMATRYAVEPNRMMTTLKATCFKGPVTDEQMVALLIVAEQYGLNPFTKEIYAFPDKSGGIVPVVGVDGWIRIINSNPYFLGMSFLDGPYNEKDIPQWVECTIKMSNREVSMVIKEWYDECYRNTPPWNDTGRRMLRHRAMIQCARIAMGYVGIYEPDEAERFTNALPVGKPATQAPRARAPAIEMAPTISLDQLTMLHDKMHTEGVMIEPFLVKHGWGCLEEIPSHQFKDAMEWLDAASASAHA